MLKQTFPTLPAVMYFLIFMSILMFLVRKPLKRFLKDRQEAIERETQEAQRLHVETEARNKEEQAKLDQLSEDVARIKEEIAAEAKAEKERILAQARKEAQGILENAKESVRREEAQLKARLMANAASLAVDQAAIKLRNGLGEKEHAALLQTLIKEVSGNG